MPYNRFRKMHPVNSDKKEQTWSLLGIDAGTAVQTVNIILVTEISTVNAGFEAGVGARIGSMYFEFHFSAAQTGNANVIHWEVVHVPVTATQSSPNTYYQNDRSKILKRGMEMLPTNVSTVFKRIFTISPRMFKRLTQGDKIDFRFQASSTQQINACDFAITKVFR